MELYVIKSGKFVLTEKGKEELIQEYNRGYSQHKIAKKFGVCYEVINRWMKENNIPTRTRKYPINENYFKDIDSEEKAYWLGFLSADGYVHNERGEIALELQESDREHLEKFKKAIGSNKPLLTILCGEQKQFTHYRFVCKCRKMVDDLKNYNVVQNKSLTFSPSENIPSEFIPYWIIGYMDGDGSVCNAKGRVRIIFTGTQKTLLFIKKYFNSSNIIRLEHRCDKTYRFALEVEKSELFLKKSNYVFLPYALNRKKERYASIIQ